MKQLTQIIVMARMISEGHNSGDYKHYLGHTIVWNQAPDLINQNRLDISPSSFIDPISYNGHVCK